MQNSIIEPCTTVPPSPGTFGILTCSNSKAVIWAHNSHLGDARATTMGKLRGEISLGQLCRQAFGDQVLSLGCGTHTGTVAAADEWDSDMRIMNVDPSLPGSVEYLAHQTGIPSFLVDLREAHCDDELRKELIQEKLERFIGVIYGPETERQSHYSHVILADQFDGYIWFMRRGQLGLWRCISRRPRWSLRRRTLSECNSPYVF